MALTSELAWLSENDGEDINLDMDERLDLESDGQTEYSDHFTYSEQSGSDGEFEELVRRRGRVPCYIGRDGSTRWKVNCPTRVTGRNERITSHLPQVRGTARETITVNECWSLFFTDEMLGDIVKFTNIYLAKMRENYRRERDCPDTNIVEFKALLGLLYLAGLKKAQHLNIKELWDDDGTSPEIFRATMSLRRFYVLVRALRFDDINDRSERSKLDNMAPIRNLFEQFVSNCKENYTIGQYATIDEMLEPFRGRCKFRQYMPNKPAKYGIKIFSLVDSRTFYTLNMEVYCGKQPDGPFKVSNSPQEVVKRLATSILNTGRNITMDNYFMSIPLAEDLLLHSNTTTVGTLRKNKREIPAAFVNIKQRAVSSNLFGFGENRKTLLSHIPKTGKNVLMLSTLHHDKRIDPETGKPEIIAFYNLTKGGVDVVDEMKSLYSVARISNRYPLTIFFSLLNIAGINSQIIYKSNTDNLKSRREFLKDLGLCLIKDHLNNRALNIQLPITLKNLVRKYANVPEESTSRNSAGFCSLCPRRKNRRTKKSCGKCSSFLCGEHVIYICAACFNTTMDKD